jgi:hypothetical protein
MRKPSNNRRWIQRLVYLITGLALFGWGAWSAGELLGPGASAANPNQSGAVEKNSPLGTNANWISTDSKRAEISVSLHAVPLATVLVEIARQTGIEIRFVGASPQSTVSTDYRDLPLEKGLAELLRTHDYAFFYTHSGDTRRLTTVFVLPAQGKALAATESQQKPNPSVTAADRAILLEALRNARDSQQPGANTPRTPATTPQAAPSPAPDNADADASRLLQALREHTSQQPATSEADPLSELLLKFGPPKEP